MKNFWDERYAAKEYVYGNKPNQFFKEQIERLKAGKILMLGEGEGRNAVYAAKLGWQVDAIDSSSMAKEKALRLAEQQNVSISYHASDLFSYTFPKDKYDAVGIIFLHLNETESELLHQKCINALRKNGKIILELFSKNQLGKNSGGPQDLIMLSSIEQIRKNFSTLKQEYLQEENILLSEGEFHQGEASVIRFIGMK
jgi:2-polyprenyl-3-methyl-5-hydroxy-6-metoxy-1,4-benzoquinol methylase